MVPLVPPHHYSLFNSVVMSSDFQSSWSADDQEFVRQVWQAYFEPLYLSAIKLCNGNSVNPDDLVMDLFVKIAYNPGTFRKKLEQEKGAGYLFAALKNKFRDILRSEKSRRQNEQAIGTLRTGQTSLYAHCANIWQEHIEHFLALVLKGRELDIMVWFSRGFKYREIAQKLGMNINTVGVSIKRSREKLIKALEDAGMDRYKNIDIKKWRRKRPRNPELFDEEE